MDTNTETTRSPRSGHIVAAIAAAIAVLLVIVYFLFNGIGNISNGMAADINGAKPKASQSATSTPSPSPTDTCTDQFRQISVTHNENKVDDGFYTRYMTAVADVTNLSDKQRELFIDEAGKDSKKLAIWSHALGLQADPNETKSLVEDDGTCLSEKGREAFFAIKGAVTAKGVTFEEAQAPENAWNSGMHDGVYGTSPEQGVRGDRTAIKITLKDGTVAYILIRCANPVYPGKPSLPDVPTDNPPPTPPTPPETPVCPPDMPHGNYPNCKDAPSRDPYARGNAPEGGGQNADPGPGVYIPPAQMEQPPSTPRPNPAPPAPEPPAPAPAQPNQPAPKPVPTKDPAPAPKPEPSAPAPSDPVGPSDPGGGCIPIPGVEDC